MELQIIFHYHPEDHRLILDLNLLLLEQFKLSDLSDIIAIFLTNFEHKIYLFYNSFFLIFMLSYVFSLLTFLIAFGFLGNKMDNLTSFPLNLILLDLSHLS